MKTLLLILLLLPLFLHAQSWVNVGSVGFSDSNVAYTSIAIDTGGTPYVSFVDYANSQKATVMKYNGSSWVNVGNPGFSAGAVSAPQIAIDHNGTPYTAYVDYGNGQKATVMKFNGSNWVTVDTAGFSDGEIGNISMAIDTGGTPYVLYGDNLHNWKATVMKFDGTNWVAVGNQGFTDTAITTFSMAIDGNGTPYVFYADRGNANLEYYPTNVMKYNGSSWVNVGNLGIQVEEVDPYISIAIDGSGTPYVAFADLGSYYTSYFATVMKYIDTNWVTVGSAEFSAGEAVYTSIAIDNNGTPYVVYEDCGNSYKATVMKYYDSAWITVGSAGLSAGPASFTSIAIDNSGTPYVAYRDLEDSGKSTVMRYGWPAIVSNLTNPSTILNIFPNPTTNQLTITTTDKITSVAITNLIGQTLYNQQYNSPQVQVDVATLPTGMYLVRINGSEVRKFVKQ